jgi:hypothetical protein
LITIPNLELSNFEDVPKLNQQATPLNRDLP